MTRTLPITLCACSVVSAPEARPADGDHLPDLGIDPSSLQYLREVVFAPQCTFASSSCHSVASHEGDLALGTVVEGRDVSWSADEEALILDSLLGADRAGAPAANPHHIGELLVVPGDCDASYLYRKVAGTGLRPPCAEDAPMPWNANCAVTMPPARVVLICYWIESLRSRAAVDTR